MESQAGKDTLQYPANFFFCFFLHCQACSADEWLSCATPCNSHGRPFLADCRRSRKTIRRHDSIRLYCFFTPTPPLRQPVPERRLDIARMQPAHDVFQGGVLQQQA